MPAPKKAAKKAAKKSAKKSARKPARKVVRKLTTNVCGDVHQLQGELTKARQRVNEVTHNGRLLHSQLTHAEAVRLADLNHDVAIAGHALSIRRALVGMSFILRFTEE